MKNHTLKRTAAALLGSAMMIGTLAGCGGSKAASSAASSTAASSASAADATSTDAPAIDTSEHVDLTMYLIGAPTEDFDVMWAKTNEYLEEKLNCTVNVQWLSWSEHATKYSLLFSGGEDFDLIFTAVNWGHYDQIAPKGGFYPLTEDFLSTYAPALMDNVAADAWDLARYDGVPYMVPQNIQEINKNAIAIRGDLMEKYGFDTIDSTAKLHDFYMACAADGIYGAQNSYFDQWYLSKGYGLISGSPDTYLFYYNADDPTNLDYYYLLDDPDFVNFCKETKGLADAGAWSADSMNSTAERQDGLLNGTCATMAWNAGTCQIYADQANASHPDWNIRLIDTIPDVKASVTIATNAGMSINAASKNPERAAMVIEMLYCDEYLQQLTRLGIEGTHWEAVGEDQYTLLKETLGVDSYCDWGWRNDKLMRTKYIPPEEQTSAYKDRIALQTGWAANLKDTHVYNGFVFDTTNVATQCAAVDTVYGTYYNALVNYGLVDDVDAWIADFKAAMDSAGIADIQTEMKSQMEAYVASK